MSVDAAVDRVRSNLKQDFFDWDVTEKELKDNNQALKELSPAQRNEAIGKLSDDELKHWADETKGLNSPLKADDRRDLLNMLAQDLDAQQLGRAAKAFGVEDMAGAVSSHGSPQQKLDFIKSLQGDANADLLRAWVEQGAALYVCGSLEGMAPGVDAALTEILGADRLAMLADAGRYRRDVY